MPDCTVFPFPAPPPRPPFLPQECTMQPSSGEGCNLALCPGQAIEKERDAGRLASLKRVTAPFLLRRLKSDRAIISDLPDKVGAFQQRGGSLWQHSKVGTVEARQHTKVSRGCNPARSGLGLNPCPGGDLLSAGAIARMDGGFSGIRCHVEY